MPRNVLQGNSVGATGHKSKQHPSKMKVGHVVKKKRTGGSHERKRKTSIRSDEDGPVETQTSDHLQGDHSNRDEMFDEVDTDGNSGNAAQDEASTVEDFKSLGLSEWLVRQASAVGITKPTLVQQNCIPAALQGIYFFMKVSRAMRCQHDNYG